LSEVFESEFSSNYTYLADKNSIKHNTNSIDLHTIKGRPKVPESKHTRTRSYNCTSPPTELFQINKKTLKKKSRISEKRQRNSMSSFKEILKRNNNSLSMNKFSSENIRYGGLLKMTF